MSIESSQFCSQLIFADGSDDRFLTTYRRHNDGMLELCVLANGLRWVKMCKVNKQQLNQLRTERQIFDEDLFWEAFVEAWNAGDCRLNSGLDRLSMSHDSFTEPLHFDLVHEDSIVTNSFIFSLITSVS